MGLVSFARGIPGPDLLPVDGFGEAARTAVERDGRTILNYGPPGGYGPLREWIAERHDVEAARVLVTNGSLQGFNFVMRRLLGEGGRAIVEAPSYDRTLLTLRALGAEVEALPLRDDGLDVGALSESLALHGPSRVATRWRRSSASTSCSSMKTIRTVAFASKESTFRRCST
jgi:2-aminoadipate transaminase